MSITHSAPGRWLQRAFDVEPDETGAVIAGFGMFFLLFAGYFMLRPVRETWVKAGIDMVAQQPAVAMVVGAGLAMAWAANGAWLGRAQRRWAAAPD